MNKLFFENILEGTLLFSRFELVRCLGASVIGGVYLCKDKQNHDKEIALKVFSTPALKEKRLQDDFEREKDLSFRITHPNVIRCHDYFADDDFTAFTMDYIDNGTLADLLVAEKFISVEKIVDLLNQLADGLHAIHSAGIVHRDLKPENILLSSRGELKITDFGIAATHGGLDCEGRDSLSGTVNYLSPEYIATGAYDARSDVYAFGVIAYELMTGRVPFNGNGLIDTLISRVRFDPLSPREVRTDIPRALSDMALKAMKRSPNKRYQSVEEIIWHLNMIRSLDMEISSQKMLLKAKTLNEYYTRRPTRLPEAA